MARLDRMTPALREHYLNMLNMPCPSFDTNAWVPGPPVVERKVALISTAGLHCRDDRPFRDSGHTRNPSYSAGGRCPTDGQRGSTSGGVNTRTCVPDINKHVAAQKEARSSTPDAGSRHTGLTPGTAQCDVRRRRILNPARTPPMVRLADLPGYERDHLLGKNLPPLEPPAWTRRAKPLAEMRVALVTTAGLHFRGDAAFDFADAGFRPIPSEADADGLVTSHSSANFDRSGLAEDVNLVFPIDRFRELEARGRIGSLADVHYSFMGAALPPKAFAASACQVAGLLRRDGVDAVFLTPV